jgi:hypothetical protein
MACAEFFAMDKGETWGVGHYLWVLAAQVEGGKVEAELERPHSFEKR